MDYAGYNQDPSLSTLSKKTITLPPCVVLHTTYLTTVCARSRLRPQGKLTLSKGNLQSSNPKNITIPPCNATLQGQRIGHIRASGLSLTARPHSGTLCGQLMYIDHSQGP